MTASSPLSIATSRSGTSDGPILFDRVKESFGYAPRLATEHQGPDDGGVSRSMTSDALALLSALENFIRPLIRSRDRHSFDTEINEGTSTSLDVDALTPEGQKFVAALGNFVLNTLTMQEAHRRREESRIPEPSETQITPPTLPQKLTDALRAHVFNDVPVRLLTFGPDGSHVQIIERNTIYDHIAHKILAKVDVDKFNSSIETEFTSRRNLQGQQLYQSFEEAEKAVISALIEEHSRYVVLSHTWIQDSPGEVTYKDWHLRSSDVGGLGHQKLSKFCRIAAQNHKVTLAWMDSVCINKSSSSELDESIRSMYKWYNNSFLCITYLADTTTTADMRGDRWFTRGWTLQELLAPRQIKFYDKNWSPLTSHDNDKHSRNIKKEIKTITTITSSELSRFHRNVHDVEISRKMQWAASREVTKEEDAAYSLMGIFGVSISIAYGEGAQRAFFRLVEAILSTSQDVWDVFNCSGPPAPVRIHHSSLIPSSPKDYLLRSPAFDRSSAHSLISSTTILEPITVTHLGVRMRVLFLLGQEALAGEPYVPYSRLSGSVTINVLKDFVYTTQTYHLFSQTAFYGRIPDSREIPAFCILNFSETTDAVYIPSDCLALGFQWSFDDTSKLTSTGNRRRMVTKEPIVLQLHDTSTDQQFRIFKKDLAFEGLQLFTLHL